MAEILSERAEITEATPINAAAIAASTGFEIGLKRYDPAGGVSTLRVCIPDGASISSIRENPVMLAAVLQRGSPAWKDCEIEFILVAVLHAAALGLDIIQGDLYPVGGRVGVSDWGKIRYARGKLGSRVRHEVVITEGPETSIPWETKYKKGIWRGPEYRAVCRIFDKEWGDVPVAEYTATLKEWFRPTPAWIDMPQHMIRLRALAKAYEQVCPVGTDPDEAPPLQGSASKV